MQISTPFDYLLKKEVGYCETFDNTEPPNVAPSTRPAYKKLSQAVYVLNKHFDDVHFVCRLAENNTIVIKRIFDGKESAPPPAQTLKRRHYTRRAKPAAAAPISQDDLEHMIERLVERVTNNAPLVQHKTPRHWWIVFDPHGVFPPLICDTPVANTVEVIEVLS